MGGFYRFWFTLYYGESKILDPHGRYFGLHVGRRIGPGWLTAMGTLSREEPGLRRRRWTSYEASLAYAAEFGRGRRRDNTRQMSCRLMSADESPCERIDPFVEPDSEDSEQLYTDDVIGWHRGRLLTFQLDEHNDPIACKGSKRKKTFSV